MSEAPADDSKPAPAQVLGAGAMLRRARQAQGLHIAALAAAIKVTPQRLELLESGQYEKLTDATFVRALAQTVCRTLKIDPAPILAGLPPAAGNRLDHVDHGLNAPFRERPGRLVPTEWINLGSPVGWLIGLVLIGAFVVYAAPAGWFPSRKAAPRVEAAASSAMPVAEEASSAGAGDAASVLAPAPASASIATPPTAKASGAASADTVVGVNSNAFPPTTAGDDAAAAASAELLQVSATAQSWIEVSDARGQALIARVIEAGEVVGIDGAPPLKLKIGNARATAVTFRGRPVELAASTRDNVARLELK